jgi:hypothetical protein
VLSATTNRLSAVLGSPFSRHQLSVLTKHVTNAKITKNRCNLTSADAPGDLARKPTIAFK